MALWLVAKSALNIVEEVEKAFTARAKFKNLSTRVPNFSFQLLYVLELVIYL
jgi:hypothetical protein